MTLARTGRSMKNFEIMAGSYLAARGCDSIVCSCGSTFWPGIARNRPAITTRSSAFDAAFDHAQFAVERAGLHLALLDHVVLVDDQHVAAALVAAERGSGTSNASCCWSTGTRTRTK